MCTVERLATPRHDFYRESPSAREARARLPLVYGRAGKQRPASAQRLGDHTLARSVLLLTVHTMHRVHVGKHEIPL